MTDTYKLDNKSQGVQKAISLCKANAATGSVNYAYMVYNEKRLWYKDGKLYEVKPNAVFFVRWNFKTNHIRRELMA